MSFDALDILIIGLLLFVIIGILIGRGDDIMNLINKNHNGPNAPRYDKKKEQNCILFYCLLLLADEILMKIGGAYWPPAIIIGIVIAVGGGIVAIWYLKKYALLK